MSWRPSGMSCSSKRISAAAGRMATSTRSQSFKFSAVSGASMAPHIRAIIMVS